jgi:hypothetical protein
MSQWAHEHPEDPEGAWEALLEAADQRRKEAKENPDRHGYVGHTCETCEQERLDIQSEEELSAHLREIHKGDEAYENLHSPAAIRRQEARDYENDRYGY